ncbi:MAG TPA: beta-ketoacyl-[acyl-carrier-protein] synthase family protein [Pirellulales bacterium]|nr:beta-ketoacyl-[acyl-carrier-protein] synthase family protein [Pirellulales bacterium]
MMRNRVVITGLGCVTPLGSEVHEVWDRLTAGRSAVGRLTLFDASHFPVQIAAEVKDWTIAEVGEDPQRWRHHPRQTLFAVASGIKAMRSAGLDTNENGYHNVRINPLRFGIYLGCGETYQDWNQFAQMMASSMDGEEFRPEKFTEQALRLWCSDNELELELNMPAAHLAALFNAQGPNANCIAACASSSQAIGEAADMIRSGEVDVMLAGGAHSMIHPFGISGFYRLSALSQRNDDPSHAVRPFDRDRDGFVVGEGAALVVLESLEHAQRRGAEIWAELTGYGSAQDAYRITDVHPHGRGAAACMSLALKDAGLRPEQINYVNAHGTGTVLNDKMETLAIKHIFGDDAYRVPISSTKSMMGHFTTAGGAIELIISVLATRNGVLPPTINYETSDPDCDLDYVPNVAREATCRHVLSNSFGFGGQNAALIVSQFDEHRRNLVAKRAA